VSFGFSFFHSLILCAIGELQVAASFHLSWNKDSKWCDAVPNSHSSRASFHKCHSFHLLLQFPSVVSFSLVFFIFSTDWFCVPCAVLHFLFATFLFLTQLCLISYSMDVHKEIALLLSLDHHFGRLRLH